MIVGSTNFPKKEKYALKSYTLQSGAGPKLPTVSFGKIFVVSLDQSGLHANHVDGVPYAAVRDDGVMETSATRRLLTPCTLSLGSTTP